MNRSLELTPRPAATPRGWTATRRAAAFGVVLLALGALAVYLRIFRPGVVHPQILLFLYSIPSNSAVSVFSHEIALYDYGSHQAIPLTVLSATLGTFVAAWLDWNVFVPLLDWNRIATYRGNRVYGYCIDRFAKTPFVMLVIAGFTPIPFFPFKFLAFSMKYPLARYLAAVTVARAPRYLLLAWLGSVAPVPPWVLLACFGALLAFALWHCAGARRMRRREYRP